MITQSFVYDDANLRLATSSAVEMERLIRAYVKLDELVASDIIEATFSRYNEVTTWTTVLMVLHSTKRHVEFAFSSFDRGYTYGGRCKFEKSRKRLVDFSTKPQTYYP